MRTDRRGLSLVEILLVCGLLLIITGLIAKALVPSFTLFHTELSGTELFQSAIMMTQRFKVDVANSMASTITLDPDKTRISYLPKDMSQPMEPGTARPRFARSFAILYYEPQGRRIYFKLWPKPGQSPPPGLFDGTLPPRLTLAQLQAATSSLNGTERPLVWDVEECEFYDSDTSDILTLPVRLRFVVSRKERKGGSEDLLRRTLAVEAYPRSVEW